MELVHVYLWWVYYHFSIKIYYNFCLSFVTLTKSWNKNVASTPRTTITAVEHNQLQWLNTCHTHPLKLLLWLIWTYFSSPSTVLRKFDNALSTSLSFCSESTHRIDLRTMSDQSLWYETGEKKLQCSRRLNTIDICCLKQNQSNLCT